MIKKTSTIESVLPENNEDKTNMADQTEEIFERRRKIPMKLVIPSLAVLLVTTIGISFYFYNKSSSNDVDQKEIAAVIAVVGELIVLPDEEPTLATVTDPEKLRDQPFFAKAKIGDKVLLYPIAKKIILYDPEVNKIIEAAVLNIETQ